MISPPQTPLPAAAEARCRALHAQLAEARAEFRAERLRHEALYRDDLTALAEARAEAESRENQAAAVAAGVSRRPFWPMERRQKVLYWDNSQPLGTRNSPNGLYGHGS